MHSNLLQQAFQKAQDSTLLHKPTHLSRHLSDFIVEDSHEPFGEKSLRNYHKLMLEGKEVNLKPFVVQALCHYLGYESYEGYIMSLPKRTTKQKPYGKQSLLSQLFTIIIVFFFFVAFLFSFGKARKPISERLSDWKRTIEFHFYRMERLMKYLQGEAA